ncbi:hypothetical protein HHE03_02840 [Helicobacter heilmannii]|uniref:hypothetical protein n=1 Tax=Helicobacter heilmannii TaxID=35817 RepID=UPI0006A127F3|nr:hypothetical protein [Helicobacter heilmannii]CRF48710.1 hypothetical protein HHE03_02840 [Helicobacter heilmannii]
MYQFYDGLSAEFKSLQDAFLEAMDDDLGHRLDLEVMGPMLKLCHRLEECGFEANRRTSAIESRLSQARALVSQAQ